MDLNFSTYVFTMTDTEYAQYPSDGAAASFKGWRWALSSEWQIALHREGNLLYCCCFRRLGDSTPSSGSFVGLAVCFNGVCPTDMETMFSTFAETLTMMAISGRVVEFSADGSLIRKGMAVRIERDDAAFVDSVLSYKVSKISRDSFTALPPVNYSSSPEKSETCSETEARKRIPALLKSVDRILVKKEGSGDTEEFLSYSRKISDLEKARQALESRNQDLSSQVQTLSRQKKQYKWVTFFGVIALVLLVVAVVFISDSATKQREIEYSVSQIWSLKQDVLERDTEIESLQKEVADKEKKIKAAETFLSGFTSETLCPFTISEVEFRNEGSSYGDPIYASISTYIYTRMKVRSLVSGSSTLTVKFYSPYGLSLPSSAPYGQDYSFTETIELKKNQLTEVSLRGWGGADRGHWEKGEYRVEFYFGDVLVGWKTFNVV